MYTFLYDLYCILHEENLAQLKGICEAWIVRQQVNLVILRSLTFHYTFHGIPRQDSHSFRMHVFATYWSLANIAIFVKIPSQMRIDGPVVLGEVKIFKYVAIAVTKIMV